MSSPPRHGIVLGTLIGAGVGLACGAAMAAGSPTKATTVMALFGLTFTQARQRVSTWQHSTDNSSAVAVFGVQDEAGPRRAVARRRRVLIFRLRPRLRHALRAAPPSPSSYGGAGHRRAVSTSANAVDAPKAFGARRRASAARSLAPASASQFVRPGQYPSRPGAASEPCGGVHGIEAQGSANVREVERLSLRNVSPRVKARRFSSALFEYLQRRRRRGVLFEKILAGSR